MEGNQNQKAKGNIGCGTLILAFIVVAVIWGAVSGGGGDSTVGNEFGAKDACQDWVKEKLKAPATADFSGVTASGPDTGPWTVTGSVDAQNSFGAKLRRSWTCTIRLDGDTYRGNATLLE